VKTGGGRLVHVRVANVVVPVVVVGRVVGFVVVDVVVVVVVVGVDGVSNQSIIKSVWCSVDRLKCSL